MLIDGNPSISVLITSALQLDFVQSGQKARGKPLRFLTWDGYIDDGLLFDFQQRFDIPIIYDSYGSEENLLSMLGSGLSYDVIINSIPHYLIENDYAAPVDLSKLSTWDEIDPMLQIMMPITDGVPTAMPYLWGTTGVAVNTNVVASFDAAPEKVLDLFFEGSQSEKYQGCIFGVLDTLDSLYLFSRLDDRLVNALAASEYEVALDLLPAFAHNVELLSGDNWLDTQRRLATGELCAAVQYSGDVVNLQNDASHVDYIFPASGAGLWVDAISIGASAEYDQSLRLVNFLSESENSAANVNWNSYASPNIFARNFIDPEILSNRAVYPAGVDMARFFSVPHEVSQDYIDIYQKFELLFSN